MVRSGQDRPSLTLDHQLSTIILPHNRQCRQGPPDESPILMAYAAVILRKPLARFGKDCRTGIERRRWVVSQLDVGQVCNLPEVQPTRAGYKPAPRCEQPN